MFIKLSYRFLFKLDCIILCILLSLITQAQENPWFTGKEKMTGTRYYLELLGGGILPFMHYTSTGSAHWEENHLLLLETGLALRMQTTARFSWLPGIKYLQHGTHLVHPDEYRLSLNYITVSLPVEMAFEIKQKNYKSKSAFLFFGGPYIALPLPGSLETNHFNGPVYKNSLINMNYGLEAGFGFRIQTFSLESKSNMNLRISWMQGFNDSFSPEEKELAGNPQSESFDFLTGKRILSGLKATLSIDIPFRQGRVVTFTAGSDGKKNYKKIVIIDDK